MILSINLCCRGNDFFEPHVKQGAMHMRLTTLKNAMSLSGDKDLGFLFVCLFV